MNYFLIVVACSQVAIYNDGAEKLTRRRREIISSGNKIYCEVRSS